MSEFRFVLLIAGAFAIATLWTSQLSAEELRADPTRPPNVSVPAASDPSPTDQPLELSAVILRPNDPIAIINGERVRLNESVGSARLTEIRADRVQLERRGKNVELKLITTDVKEESQ